MNIIPILKINIINKSTIKLFAYVVLCFNFIISYAGMQHKNNSNNNNLIYQEITLIKQQALTNARQYREEVKQLAINSNNVINNNKINQSDFLTMQSKMLAKTFNNVANAPSNDINTNKQDKILVFVSFAMPDVALQQLLLESAKYNAMIIIQGLIDSSMPKTLAKITKLVAATGNKGGVQINPNLFLQYHIQKVPAYVIANTADVAINAKNNNNNNNKQLNSTTATHIVYGLTGVKQAVEVFSNANLISKALMDRILNNA